MTGRLDIVLSLEEREGHPLQGRLNEVMRGIPDVIKIWLERTPETIPHLHVKDTQAGLVVPAQTYLDHLGKTRMTGPVYDILLQPGDKKMNEVMRGTPEVIIAWLKRMPKMARLLYVSDTEVDLIVTARQYVERWELDARDYDKPPIVEPAWPG